MFTTHGINHLTFYVADLERSLAFYQQILRMKVVHRGAGYAYLESGRTWFCLSEQKKAELTLDRNGLHHLALTVHPDEFDAAVQHVKQHGVPIVREEVVRGVGRAINFLDPDGVQWEFHDSTLTARMTVIHEMEAKF